MGARLWLLSSGEAASGGVDAARARPFAARLAEARKAEPLVRHARHCPIRIDPLEELA